VLVVDDEHGMREGCRRILTSEGHTVTTAESGEQALAGFRVGEYELALLDLRMPGLSGIEVMEQFRGLDADLLCLVVTAYATLETAVQATKRGAYDYLAKPFTPEELLSVVNRALEVQWLTREAARLREEAERNLLLVATEQSRTRTIIQGMADGVLVTNREGDVALYNPAALRLLGIKTAPEVGAPLSPDLFPRELVGWMEEAREPEGATMVSRELPGGPPQVAANVAMVREEGGEALGVVAVLRDITALKSLQQAMADFTRLVAHELRAPLGAIVQYLEILLGGITTGQPEKERQMLERCRERTLALSQLVRDLLDLSAMQARAERSLREVSLGEVASEVVEFLAPTARERGVTVTTRLPEDLPPVMADRNEMTSVVTNLLSNAIKYNRAGGGVEIAGKAGDGYVELAVADTGMGIPAEAVGKLGEAFYRVRNAQTTAITGTGLGLSICREIVAAHHGHLEIESEEGKGSVFRVLLPRRGLGAEARVAETSSSEEEAG
jgi:PAS domain S-box-containing protein